MAQDDWQDLLREASRLRALGQVEEAIATYQQLLAAKPDLPDSWYNLGWLQRRARLFEPALDSYQRALDIGVREPEEVHLNRAVIYSDHLHRPEDAARELNAALGHNPDHVPALLNLGNLREDQGDPKGARDAYQRALGVDPANSLALARLATLAHSSELDAALASRVRTAISLPSAAPADQADLGFALAGMLDAAGQYDEAFRAATQANAASRAAAGPSHAYDRAGTEAFIDRIIGAFDRPQSGTDNAAPIFICGLFRSGSTLTEQILGAHSRVHPSGELEPLLAFLGLEWEDRLLEFHRSSSTVKSASVWQVRQPLHGRSSGRWRNYQAHLEPIAASLLEKR